MSKAKQTDNAPSIVETTTTHEGQKLETTVTYDFGATVEEMVEKFGEKVIYSQILGALKISLQNYVRGLLRQGKDAKEIQKAVDAWKPGTKARGKSKIEKLREELAKMSEEERKALLSDQKEAA